MPDAVKISDLPEISSLAREDILPIVDEALTQTSKATLGQIKDMQAGVNSVVTESIANAAVTPGKTGFSAPFMISASNLASAQTPAGNYIGQEMFCSAYIQGLFASPDGPSARAYLNALQSTDNPFFTGQVRFEDGTAQAPSITNDGDLRTGLYFPSQNTVGVTADGKQVVRFSPSGFRTAVTNYTSILPHDGVRAWAVFDGSVGGSFTLNNPHEIAARVDKWPGTLRWDEATRAKLAEVEAARGIQVSLLGTNRDDGRSNYTTPGDNVHYYWDGTNWQTTSATGESWIGTATFTQTGTSYIRESSNIAAIESIASPAIGYRVHFLEPMPTTNYALVTTGNNLSYATSLTRAATYFEVRVLFPKFEIGGIVDASEPFISCAVLI